MTVKSAHIRIEGRVQGVFYRAWTQQNAEEFGLEGWVRNRQDGSVEAFFTGEATYVDEMIELCEEGPPQARVDRVEILPDKESYPEGFEVLPTC